jgi:ABC-type transport system involved in Fe-S cluster assembly fused permease/ATPase subunit
MTSYLCDQHTTTTAARKHSFTDTVPAPLLTVVFLLCCCPLQHGNFSAGTRSIQMLYRAVLFTFAPTFIELVFVVGLLATKFSPMVAVLVGGTFVLYVAWTIAMTQVRLRDWVQCGSVAVHKLVVWVYGFCCCQSVFVVGLLATKFSPMAAVLVGCTFVLYVAWTIAMTQVRHSPL